ncbi:hypothetical protein ACFQX8_08590 [Klenkia terrae]
MSTVVTVLAVLLVLGGLLIGGSVRVLKQYEEGCSSGWVGCAAPASPGSC